MTQFLVPSLELIRLEEDEEFGTFGVLRINKILFCATLEPPDRENIPNRSSIPAQQYSCSPFNSPKFGYTYKVDKVPGRSYVLFHAGNLVEDTQGCILLGQYWGKLGGDRAVKNSGATFKSFMNIMKGQKLIKLSVTEVY